MASEIISVIGTAVSILSLILSEVPKDPSQAKVSYIIANDHGKGDLNNGGGDLPDVRLWDETAEYLGGSFDPGYCNEGATDCTTSVNTNQGASYTLFTGNDDAICISWTGMAWAGGHSKFGFHPGNWAYACNQHGGNAGSWYYASQIVPGIKYPDEVYCAWVDKNGDVPTTGFQVHWPEFDHSKSDPKDLDYYCNNDPPVYFHQDHDPSSIKYWVLGRRDMFSRSPSEGVSPVATIRDDRNVRSRADADKRAADKFRDDPRLIKSYYENHTASRLCDKSLKAAGQSFVSYTESKFCFMPTKTLYDFCENVEDGPCWDDAANNVTVKGSAESRLSLPDLSHITKTIVWGKD